ncbi:ABC transporter substrate-binding protein [Sphingomonas sp. G-3-2-10]|uniref:ABC transporter substrate-binding protein n=1 Tax=Sphingomonas sp. G-3-2-10 TaxID=2728838 RepID=UPI00146A41BA|nr:ABC transporter substrate-binding protein [Sphingomonas sp. G-3-2-10]NML06487.1 ABC transporter substrate-binding protein [Sphingomonas sp. G-3-2-10]
MALPFTTNGFCWSAAALLLFALSSCAAPPTAGGGGIVSINPCGDAMLVELAPDRIASISHYSLDPAATSIPPEVARRYRTNAGTAEEIVAMRPDLVIGDTFTSPAARGAFERAGLKTLYLDSPNTIEGSKEQVTKLAAALGVEPAGRAMNARIDRAVSAATWTGPKVPALLWIGGNLANGGGTLLDEMMVRAGFSNHAAHYGLQFTDTLPIEHVVIDPPRVMLVPYAPGRMASSRAAEMRGRAIARTGAKVTQANFPRNLVNCGGPVIAKAMTRLAEVRQSIR